jgi:hypothetical protein
MQAHKLIGALVASGALVGGTLVVGATAAGASPKPASSGGASPAHVVRFSPDKSPSCKGYTLFFDWTDTGSYYQTTWSVCKNHTFSSGDGGAGSWSKSGKHISLTYTVNGDAVYSGTTNKHGMCSVSKPCSMTSDGVTGEWYAVKIKK